MSNMALEDVLDTIRIKKDTDWFLDYFEITIEDMVDRFKDLVRENMDDLPYELEMDFEPTEYEDR